MSDAPPRIRWRFSLRDLMLAVACLSLLLAALLPYIRRGQEAARQNQCGNNLKQFGLATHLFHDTYGVMPPLGLGEGHAGFFVIAEP